MAAAAVFCLGIEALSGKDTGKRENKWETVYRYFSLTCLLTYLVRHGQQMPVFVNKTATCPVLKQL